MMSHPRLLFAFAVWAVAFVWTARAADENRNYFVSTKDETVNMREGPGENYRIKWVYHHRGLPLEVIASYDAWRRVRDMDGEIGWINAALLSRDRTAVVVGQAALVMAGDDTDSPVLAQAQPGAIGRLLSCRPQICEVKFDGAEGWVPRARLWGVHGGEEF
jgi:SH3-like domain-containing protein